MGGVSGGGGSGTGGGGGGIGGGGGGGGGEKIIAFFSWDKGKIYTSIQVSRVPEYLYWEPHKERYLLTTTPTHCSLFAVVSPPSPLSSSSSLPSYGFSSGLSLSCLSDSPYLLLQETLGNENILRYNCNYIYIYSSNTITILPLFLSLPYLHSHHHHHHHHQESRSHT